MSTSFSVRIVDMDGEGIEGVRVYANFGILNGGHEEYTDEDGWAEFYASGDFTSVEFIIDGDSHGEYGLSDGETFSFTM